MPAQSKAPYALRDALISVYAADPSDAAEKRGPRRDRANRVCATIDYTAKYVLDLSFKIPGGLAADGFPLQRVANTLSGVTEKRCYSTEELCTAIAGVCNIAGASYAKYTVEFGIGRSTLKSHVKDFRTYCKELCTGTTAAALKQYECQYISLPGRPPNNTLDEERLIVARC